MTPDRDLCTPPYRNRWSFVSAPLKSNFRSANGKLVILGAPVLAACHLAYGRNIRSPDSRQLHSKKYVYPWMARSRIVDDPNRAQARLPARDIVFQWAQQHAAADRSSARRYARLNLLPLRH